MADGGRFPVPEMVLATSAPSFLNCANRSCTLPISLTSKLKRRAVPGNAADPFAIEHDQGVVDLLEATLVAERRKPAIDCAPRRQIARQQASRTARPHHIEDAVRSNCGA
jgi:hypothetical protein